jgi:hypothetical protein
MSGIGVILCGVDRWAFPKEIEISSLTLNCLVDENGIQQSARKLSAISGDYEFDSSGNLIGTSSIRNKIIIALKTN